MQRKAKIIKVLLISEWGWPGLEIRSLLEMAANVEFKEIKRHEMMEKCPDLLSIDVVLTYGPHTGGVKPLLKRINALRARDLQSPKFVWWLNENIPNLNRPLQAQLGGFLRLTLDEGVEWLPDAFKKKKSWLESLGHRYRIFGSLMWAKKRDLLDLLVVTSGFRKYWLEKFDIAAHHVPMGWGPSDHLGRDLGLDRDIQVLWLGRPSSFRQRRDNILNQVIEDLAGRNISVKVVAGEIGFEERSELINRSVILLNLLREEHDFTGHRLLLGAANKSLVISESMVDETPFIDRKTIVFSPVAELAQTIEYYLEHSVEREQIVDAAYRFVHDELSMKSALLEIFRKIDLHLEYDDISANLS